MKSQERELSPSFSTGSGGAHFEAQVQAYFLTLMITHGCVPCLPCWPIVEIKLQGRVDGFQTDDLIIYIENQTTKERRKLLCQVKSTINITKGDKSLSEALRDAWNDFNNPEVFSKENDVIVLITNHLNKVDTSAINWILSYARTTRNVDEFYRYIEKVNFSPNKCQEKLDAIHTHIANANNQCEITKGDLYSFLQHFYLLSVDFGIEVGTTQSLLFSHISHTSQYDPSDVWSKLIDFVQGWGKNSGTINISNIPDDIYRLTKQRKIVENPIEVKLPQVNSYTEEPYYSNYADELAVAALIGGWNEKFTADIEVIEQITDQPYDEWNHKIKKLMFVPNSPISLNNGIWNISQRENLLKTYGERIFDKDIDTFIASVKNVLSERDPSFDLPINERYLSNIYEKKFKHSSELRKSLAEGLALIGVIPEYFNNCSYRKPEIIAIQTIREIFSDADSIIWGSLNDLLPILSEVAPGEFLSIIEKALQDKNCPFDYLFLQEGSIITGRNYLTGLLWSLESLAWEEDFFIRSCVILGELANHDPGGKSGNRPLNSLITILLPWYPQTKATPIKRKIVITNLLYDLPEITWKLLINLLPGENQTSFGSNKPILRNKLPTDWKHVITKEENSELVLFYCDTAITLANHNPERLVVLIDRLNRFDNISLEKIITILSSDQIVNLQEETKYLLWTHLKKFLIYQHRLNNETLVLSDDILKSIEKITDNLAPKNPLIIYQYIFNNRDFDHFEELSNFDEQRRKLDNIRKNAIKELLSFGGVDAVKDFSLLVDSPYDVGRSLGLDSNPEIDTILLPDLLSSTNKGHLIFLNGYIFTRQSIEGWKWVDAIPKSNWSPKQLGIFLSFLPFDHETWKRVHCLLNDTEGDYWLNVTVNPYQTQSNLGIAIKKLIEFDRPVNAIDCLYKEIQDNHQINISLCIRALTNLQYQTSRLNQMDEYYIVGLIKYLQENADVPQEDLCKVEWLFLSHLTHGDEIEPKCLLRQLSEEPRFFSEIISMIFRKSRKGKTNKEPSEQVKAKAYKAFLLLQLWRTPPGSGKDGSFDEAYFRNWLDNVKELCINSGHLDAALVTVGEVLIHSPKDKSGFWINHSVANILNNKDANLLREGFEMALFNSRGIHTVDPTGKPEIALATYYRNLAEETENNGYHRLALLLRDIGEGYKREAERIINKR